MWHRAAEIGAVLGEAIDQGYGLAFFTLTMRHTKADRLKPLLTGASKGWGRCTAGYPWIRDCREFEIEGWVRNWEVTYGRNGWHVHSHSSLVIPRSMTSSDLDRLGMSIFGRWSKGVQSVGLDAPRLIGQDWHLVGGADGAESIGRYLAKLDQGETAMAIGQELTHNLPGRARSGLRTLPHWSLLEEATQTGEIGRWHEWEKSTKGRRSIGWSRGLRERFAPTLDDVTDEEIAARELGSADDDLVHIPNWGDVVRHRGLALRIIEAGESGGLPAVRHLLSTHGINHEVMH